MVSRRIRRPSRPLSYRQLSFAFFISVCFLAITLWAPSGVRAEVYVGTQVGLRALFFSVDTCSWRSEIRTSQALESFLFEDAASPGQPTIEGFYRVCSYGKVAFRREDTAFLGPLRVDCTGTFADATRNATFRYDLSKSCGFYEMNAVQRAARTYAQQQASAGLAGGLWTGNLSGLVASRRLRLVQFYPLQTPCPWPSSATTGCLGSTCSTALRLSVSSTSNFFYALLRSLQSNFGVVDTRVNGTLFPDGDVDPVPSYASLNLAPLVSRLYESPYVCHNAPNMYRFGWASPVPGGNLSAANFTRPYNGWVTGLHIPTAAITGANYVSVNLERVGSVQSRVGSVGTVPPTVFISYRALQNGSRFDGGIAPSQNGAVFVHTFIESQSESAFGYAPELVAVLREGGKMSFDTPTFTKFSSSNGTGGNVRVVLRKVLGSSHAVIDICRITAARECDGGEAACSDGIDQDCDGLIDADDPDCDTSTACGAKVPPPPQIHSPSPSPRPPRLPRPPKPPRPPPHPPRPPHAPTSSGWEAPPPAEATAAATPPPTSGDVELFSPTYEVSPPSDGLAFSPPAAGGADPGQIQGHPKAGAPYGFPTLPPSRPPASRTTPPPPHPPSPPPPPPLPTTVCQIQLRNTSTAFIRCSGPKVSVSVGWSLQAHLTSIGRMSSGAASPLIGVQLVPSTDVRLRGPYADWGVTFVNVSHNLVIANSTIYGLPMTSAGPLLGCIACARVVLRGVQMSRLQSSPSGSKGAVQLAGVQAVEMSDVACTQVVHDQKADAGSGAPGTAAAAGSYGACFTLQYQKQQPMSVAASSSFVTVSLSLTRVQLQGVATAEGSHNLTYGALVISRQQRQPSTDAAATGSITLDVTVANSVLQGNRGVRGAAFAFLGDDSFSLARLSITQTLVRKNSALLQGGAFWLWNSAGSNTLSLELRNSSFVSNVCQKGDGGVLWASCLASVSITDGSVASANQAGTFVVRDDDFTGSGGFLHSANPMVQGIFISGSALSSNRAAGWGAVFSIGLPPAGTKLDVTRLAAAQADISTVQQALTRLQIVNSSITTNSAGLGGGCMAALGSIQYIDVTTSQMSANAAGAAGSELYRGAMQGSGGCFWLSGSADFVTLTASNVSENTAATDGGNNAGGWLRAGPMYELRLLSGTNVLGNRALTGGFVSAAALDLLQLDYQVTMTGNVAIRDSADANGGSGGCVAITGQLLEVQASNFVSITNNRAESDGGCIYAGSINTLGLSRSTVVRGNLARIGNGGFATSVTFTSGFQRSISVTNSSVISNTAVQGGFVFVADRVSVRVSADALVQGNTAIRGDGGVIASQGDVTFAASSGALVQQNVARGSGGVASAGGGGGLSSISIDSGAAVVGNLAQLDGGVMAAARMSALVIINGSCGNNSASRDGGVLAVSSLDTLLVGQRGQLSGNRAVRNGGCVLASSSLGNFTSTAASVVRGNRAGANGGVVSCGETTSSLADSLLQSSSTSSSSSSTSSSSTINSSNSSSSSSRQQTSEISSAQQRGSSSTAVGLRTLLVSGIVEGNEASNDGGFVWASQLGTINLMNATITRQYAGRHGGVLCASSVGSLSASSALLAENVAGQGDGGILAVSTLGTMAINGGSVLRNNRAWRHGAVLSCGSEYSVETVTRDDGAGGGGAATTGALWVEDTELLGNRALNGNGGALRFQLVAANLEQQQLQTAAVIDNVTVDLRRVRANNCSAGADGGVLAVSGTAVVRVADSKFEGSVAGNRGGAIATERGTALFTINTSFSGNAAKLGGSIALDLTAVTAAAATAAAGFGSVTLPSSCAAAQQDPATAAAPAAAAAAFICSCSITDGSASQDGGGLYALLTAAVDSAADTNMLVIRSSQLQGNTARASGGAIAVIAAQAAAAASVQAAANTDAAAAAANTAASIRRRRGRAMAAASEVLMVPDDSSSAPDYFTYQVLLQGTNLKQNAAAQLGGAVIISGATLMGEGLTLLGNTAGVQQDSSSNSSSSSSSSSRQQQANAAVVQPSEPVAAGDSSLIGTGMGGAIAVVSQAAGLLLRNTTIRGSSALQAGGGIYASDCAALLLHGSALLESTAARGPGGGMYVAGCANISVQASHIANCTGTSGGGAFLIQQSSNDSTGSSRYMLIVIHGTSFSGNAALSPGSRGPPALDAGDVAGRGVGGALHLGGRVAVLVRGTTFTDNTATGAGASISSTQQCGDGGGGSSGAALLPWPELLLPDLQERMAFAALREWATNGCALLGMVDVGLVQLQQQQSTPPAAAAAALIPAASGVSSSLLPQQHLWLSDPYASAVKVACRQRSSGGPSGGDGGSGGGAAAAQTTMNTTNSNGKAITGHAQNLVLLRSSLQSCVDPLPATQQQPEADNGGGGGGGDGRSSASSAGGPFGGAASAADGLLFLTPEAVRLSIVEIDPQQPQQQQERIPDAAGATSTSGASPAVIRLWPLLGTAAAVQPNASSSGALPAATSKRLVLPTGSRLRLVAELVSAVGDVVLGYPPVTLRLTLEPAAWVRLQPQADAVTDQTTGQAEWNQVVVHGWPGDSYTLRVAAVGTEGGAAATAAAAPQQQLAADELPVTLQPCAQGEEIDNGASALAPPLTSCRRCDSEQYSLWRDPRPAAQSGINLTSAAAWQADAGTAAQCRSCPARATCTGGAVLVPEPGYWHSSPQSTLMHSCPNPDACQPRDFSPGSKAAAEARAVYARLGADVNAPLIVCQEHWYASLIPGSDVLQQLRQARSSLADINSSDSGGTSISSSSSTSGSVVANSSAVVAPLISDVCVLVASVDTKGVDDQVLYVNWQCAEGYIGRLCATCLPGLYLSSDYECQACPPLGLNLFLGLLAFFANVVLMLYTSWTAYTDEGGGGGGGDAPAPPEPGSGGQQQGGADEEVGVSEKLKAIIVHVQYFIIITRLNLNWPRIIHKLAAGFGTLTGASNFVTFAPSCFFPDYTSDGQARLTVFYSLAAPCLAVLLCLALWALRYQWFNQSRMKRVKGRRYDSGSRSASCEAARRRRGGSVLRSDDLAALAAAAAAVAGPSEPGSSRWQNSVYGGPASESPAGSTAEGAEGVREAVAGIVAEAGDGEPAAVADADATVDFTDDGAEAAASGSGGFSPDGRAAAELSISCSPAAAAADSDSGSSRQVQQLGSIDVSLPPPPPPAAPLAPPPAPAPPPVAPAPPPPEPSEVQLPPRDSVGKPRWRMTTSSQRQSSAAGVSTAGDEAGTSRPTPPPGRHSRSSTASSALRAVMGKIRSSTAGTAAGMRHLDQTVGLPGQLLIVLLVSVFILYPGLVQASLSIFACHALDDGSGPYPETQTATWRYGYWMRDTQQQCYTDTHAALYLPLGIVAVVLFCAAPPLAFFSMLWRHRSRLDENHTKRVYGFLYSRFRRSYYFYEGVRQLQTLALVCVDVFGYTLPVDRQALLLQAILVAIGAMNMTTNALRARVLAVMEFLSLSVLVLTINLGLFFAMESTAGASSSISESAAENVVGILIILLNTCLVAGFVVLIAKSALPRVGGVGHTVKRFISNASGSAGRWICDQQPAPVLSQEGCAKSSGGMLQVDESGYKTA